MNTSEWLKKISFREGFFLSVVLVAIVCYICGFVSVPTMQTWKFGGMSAIIVFFVLCILAGIGMPSRQRAERMQIIAGVCLTLIFLVSAGLGVYIFFVTNALSTLKFVEMLVILLIGYVFCLFIECIAFFQYEERRANVTGGLVYMGKDIHNGHVYTYNGLGKEPYWNETLPERVNDYTEPRYVYADKFESSTPTKGHGRVIGYRISPTLVIHSMVAQDYNGIAELKPEILHFIDEYGGKMLVEEDMPVLRDNWNTINNMRTTIGDTPLPEAVIPFVLPDHSVRTMHIFDGRVFTDPKFGSIIMKR